MVSVISTRSQSAPTRRRAACGVLRGTLQIPGVGEPFPVALIIGGSGPVDRDGNNSELGLKTDCYQQLAEGLACYGIASLRYDKRGAGTAYRFGAPEASLRFETYVGDAVGWAKKLRQDKRFSRLTIIGHSEGSLIGMLVAREVEADGFISIAGAAHPAGEVLRAQLKSRLPPNLFKSANRILAKLMNGKPVKRVPRSLLSVFRPSVQPFLMSWMRYHPVAEIAKLRMGVLIVHGARDLQVPSVEGRDLRRALPWARLAIVPGMNHVMKDVKGSMRDNIRAYGDPTRPINSRMLEAIGLFVQSFEMRKGTRT